MIHRLLDAGMPVEKCCKVLGVSGQGYYLYKRRLASATQLRRQLLTGLIREIPTTSRSSTTVSAATQRLATAHRSSTNFSPTKKPSRPTTHHQWWKSKWRQVTPSSEPAEIPLQLYLE